MRIKTWDRGRSLGEQNKKTTITTTKRLLPQSWQLTLAPFNLPLPPAMDLKIQAILVNFHPTRAGFLLQSQIGTLKRDFSLREPNRTAQPAGSNHQVHLSVPFKPGTECSFQEPTPASQPLPARSCHPWRGGEGAAEAVVQGRVVPDEGGM